MHARALSSIARLYTELGILHWLVLNGIDRDKMFRMLCRQFVTCNRQCPAPTTIGNKCRTTEAASYKLRYTSACCCLLAAVCVTCWACIFWLAASCWAICSSSSFSCFCTLRRANCQHVFGLCFRVLAPLLQQCITKAASDTSEHSGHKV